MLGFFLIRRQSFVSVLWRGYFQWTRPKASVKERILTKVTSLQLTWKCSVLEMFIQELGQNFQDRKLFPMYAKQKALKYSPSVVLQPFTKNETGTTEKYSGVVYVIIGNRTFCLALYLTGVRFRGELRHVGTISEQKLKCRPNRTRKIGGVRLSDELYRLNK